ncbi:MAG: chitobiase/beta-hexosaminidase C-terminal domain-containing protein [Terracidiphilus sp.]|jgi:hypothetical protein
MRVFSIGKRLALIGALTTAVICLVGCRTQPPLIQPPQGIYACPAEVKITDKEHHAKIYYTTDGTEPTKLSVKYSGPFLVPNSGTVKAVARAEDDKPSKVKAETYTCQPAVNQVDLAVLLQLSFNLPPPLHAVTYTDIHPNDLVYPAAQALAPFTNRQVLCPNCLLSANFSPQRPASRAEAAVILVSILMAGQKVQLLSAASSDTVLSSVPDAVGLHAFERRYIATAIQNGVLALQAGNTVQAAQPLTHADLTAALSAIQNNFGTVVVPPK